MKQIRNHTLSLNGLVFLFGASVVLLGSDFAVAQTNPIAQAVPYSQNFSGLLYTSTAYPTGLQGWTLASATSASFRTTAATADVALQASSSASTTAGGVHNYNGKIGFLGSSSVDPSICFAIVTSGLTNIQVAFDAMTIRNPYDGTTNTRINMVDLQYRVGTSGGFVSVSGNTNGVYQNTTTLQTGSGVTTPQNVQNVSLTLPSPCNNQPIVQLRLVQRDVTGQAGSRPSFAFDNITVSGSSASFSISCPANISTPAASGQCGANVSYTATTSGSGCGTPSVAYSIAPGSFFAVGTTTVAATATDACNNTSSCSFTVTVTPPPVPTITAGGPTTFCSSGSVTLTASAGSNYSWSPGGATTQSITATSSGSYSVTVNNGCVQTSSATIVTVNSFSASGNFFAENMGTVASTTAISAHSGWQNNGIYTYTGTADVRVTSPSSGYTGASGSANIFFTNNGTANFQVSGINTSAYGSPTLSFGAFKSTTASDMTEFLVQYSTDGVNYFPVSFPAQATGSGTAVWRLVTATTTLPSTSNLRLRWTNTSTTAQFRLDDIGISGTSGSVSIATNGPTTFCNGGGVVLTSSVATGNSWSPGGQTTQSITVSAPDTYTLTATSANTCTATASQAVTVNYLHSTDLVSEYDYSCDRTTSAFSPVSQTFTASTTGYIAVINAGIGLNGTPTAYGTTISAGSRMVNYGTLPYSGRCCYALCVTGNNMASTTLPTPFFVMAGESVTISFTGSGGEKHYEGGILRMFIQAHPLAIAAITASGPTTFCQGGSVTLDAGHFNSYAWTPSGSSETINVTSTGNYNVTVTDVNGCTGTAFQSVTVNPNPTASVGPFTNVSCAGGTNGCIDINASGSAAPYSFNLSGNITSDGVYCGLSANTYSVTVTDNNSCAATINATVGTATDNVPPVITATGMTLTLGCNPSAQDIEDALGTATATDNCSVGAPSYNDGPVTGTCSRSQTRTWNVSDASGNPATPVSRTVTWTQVTAPVITGAPAGSDLGCNPTLPSCSNTVTASNECGGVTVICSAGDITSNGCQRSQAFTYTATDLCSNLSAVPAVVNYTWNEVTAPVLSGVPAGGPLGCNPVSLPSCDNTVSAANQCGTITVLCTPGDVMTNGCHRTQVFTYDATDECSNLSAVPAMVTYTWSEDLDAPSVQTTSETTSLGCNPSEMQIEDALGTVVVNNNQTVPYGCDNNVVSHEDNETVLGCIHTLTRTWTVTNSCNHLTATASHTISWNVVTAPVITNTPSGGYQGCNPALPACDGNVAAHNECGGVNVNCNPGTIASNGCGRTQSFTYTATDNCSGLSATPVIISYSWTEDHENPVINLNAATVIGCNPTADVIAAAFGSVASVNDNCSTGLFATGSVGNETGSGCTYSTTKTWTAIDACGNTGTTSQTVTYTRDTQAPSIACPNNIVITGTATTASWTTPGATDNCGTPTVTQTAGPASGSPFPIGVTTIEYTATDGCNNSRACSFTVTRSACNLILNAGSNEDTYFGYTADQSITHNAIVTGGSGNYSYTWTLSRGLMCNQVNTAGDESFASGSCAYTCTGTTAYSSTITPTCTGTSSSVTLTLLAPAVVTLTVVDNVNHCTASSGFNVNAVDARCFAGNSGNAKVTICHRAGNNWVQICVDESAVANLLAQGDYLGRCTTNHRPDADNAMSAEPFLNVYPNPFSESTTIAFSVPEDGNAEVKVFNALGEQVQTLFSGIAKSSNVYKISFNASDMPTGIYLFSLTSSGLNETKRVNLTK
jgi:hypothetical protein